MQYITNTMQKVIRLDTETFIQQCRNGYDLHKIKDRICQLQLTLNVRNKQIQLLTSQLNRSHQENILKIKSLEQRIVLLQQECTELRLANVRTKRLQSQKAEQQIKAVRSQYQAILHEQQQKHLKAYRTIEENYRQQLQKKDEKKIQILHFKQEQSKTYEEIKQEKIQSSEIKLKNIEKEKSELLLAKKEAQKRVWSLTQNYKNIKEEYEELLCEKQDTIISLKGQLEGYQLKQRLVNQQMQQQRHRYSQLKFNKYDDLENLRMLNQKLQNQNKKLSELLDSQNEEIMEWLNQSRNKVSRKIVVPQIEQCEHIGLINQLQRSLDLKELQLQQIKKKMDQWTGKIGFEQPIASRLKSIFNKAEKVDKLKTNQTKALREKGNQYNNNKRQIQ